MENGLIFHTNELLIFSSLTTFCDIQNVGNLDIEFINLIMENRTSSAVTIDRDCISKHIPLHSGEHIKVPLTIVGKWYTYIFFYSCHE